MTSSSTVVPLRQPDEVDDPLTAILRSGARRLLAQAVRVSTDPSYYEQHADSVELWSPGNPTFPEPEGSPDASNASSLHEVLVQSMPKVA